MLNPGTNAKKIKNEMDIGYFSHFSNLSPSDPATQPCGVREYLFTRSGITIEAFYCGMKRLIHSQLFRQRLSKKKKERKRVRDNAER